MKRLIGVCAGYFLALGGAHAADDSAAWKPLFNGKNLDGWSVHYASKAAAGAPAPTSLFKVEDGAIHVYPSQAAGSEQPNAILLSEAEH